MTFREVLTASHFSGPVLCAGVDPHPEVLADWGCSDSASGVQSFVSLVMTGVLESGVRAVKPQVALFERHGIAGMSALSALLGDLRSAGVLSIGDAKRGDIGSTMAAYADAWLLPGADFEVDALTVSPYLGVGAILPALECGAEHGKGVFVLAATSNPEAPSLQGAVRPSGLSVAQQVVNEVHAFHMDYPNSHSTHGVVVGATVAQNRLGLTLSAVPGMPVLAPGFGAQGVALSDARKLFPASQRLFPVAARSLLTGGPDGFADRIRYASAELGQ